jgi:hypothetical protein
VSVGNAAATTVMIGTTGLPPAGAREGGRHHWPNVAGEPRLYLKETHGRNWDFARVSPAGLPPDRPAGGKPRGRY